MSYLLYFFVQTVVLQTVLTQVIGPGQINPVGLGHNNGLNNLGLNYGNPAMGPAINGLGFTNQLAPGINTGMANNMMGPGMPAAGMMGTGIPTSGMMGPGIPTPGMMGPVIPPNGMMGQNLAAPAMMTQGLSMPVMMPTGIPTGFPNNMNGPASGIAGLYGGVGSGDLKVAGELPVAGTTVVAGQVPVVGAVQFGGDVRAGGVVTISGSCGCGNAF